jgi:hypothetical protein
MCDSNRWYIYMKYDDNMRERERSVVVWWCGLCGMCTLFVCLFDNPEQEQDRGFIKIIKYLISDETPPPTHTHHTYAYLPWTTRAFRMLCYLLFCILK